MLLGDLFRRGGAAARRAPGRAPPRPRLRAPGGVLEPVEALERPRDALGLRRRRRGDPEVVPALSHVSQRRHERRGAGRERLGGPRRGARSRQPGALPREARPRHAYDPRGSRRRAPRRGVLPLGAHADCRHRIRAAPVRRAARHRSSGELSRADFGRRQPRGRPHPHGPGRRYGRVRRGGPARRRILEETMNELQNIVEQAWEDRAKLSPGSAPAKLGEAVNQVLDALDQGRLRVAEKTGGEWRTHQWLKKAVLLSFRLEDNRPVQAGALQFYDKVPTKFERYDAERFARGGFRVVPPAVARRGAYIAKNVVMMPSYVNVGAYVDEGTMVDTWATVGSCAQIGRNVHLSGGVGIGCVLEPLQ